MIRFVLLTLLAYFAAVLETVIAWPSLLGSFVPSWFSLVLVMSLFLLKDSLRVPFALVLGLFWDAAAGWPLGVGMLSCVLLSWASLHWREFWLCKSAIAMMFLFTLLAMLLMDILSGWLAGTPIRLEPMLKAATASAVSSTVLTLLVLGTGTILGTGLFEREPHRRKSRARWSMLGH